MMHFYSSMAVYTNPGRHEKPSEAKIRDLDEQIQFIKRGIGTLPSSALQIGSSDGYTLSRFQHAGVTRVLGVEPGEASVSLAKRLYNVECINDSAENFKTTETFELIILTHVLEHLYEPQTILNKCRHIQNPLSEGFIYVEVPLLAPPKSLCPGFFAFEHINYYTRENLLKSLLDTGYYPVSVIEHYNSNLSPIIGVLASTKPQYHTEQFVNQYEKNAQKVQIYRQQEVEYWQQKLDVVLLELQQAKRVYLWGAGIHTCQLVANTNLLQHVKITGLTDTSELKWGLKQGDWECVSPDSIQWQPGDVVLISSYASEKEIFDALQWLRDKKVYTLRLHHVDDTKAH
ncbi:class I SAM-dependent methyltransferase [Shewanella sp. C32]|uniref:Class I SAM-dependent methyltransferase n=1 Tax=Shewanella electrica TaxID=515560 RepID=A0ABT2FJB4_9GAMM|nr:methyltransferase domain-containing protein [Shewanella electrica]MCH1924520.1 class I SAM-dependent methyltransferase [Shewanella electrica]MCS4556421.1 class I SAM-dependent methyltransferase [Shewanella electrica]